MKPLVIGALVILLCLTAIIPLLRTASPCSHDGDFHYFRVVAMRSALEQGLLFTRWLPDLAFGYGYPFFNYRAPLSYYLALGLWLTGLPLPLALNGVYVLSIIGSAVGAYLLARDLFGQPAGIAAAVAYAYTPYQFLDALLRANAPESVALALFPFILWAFRRLALGGGRRWFLAATGLLTALYLTHNISSLTFTPFLLAYMAVLGWVYRRRGRWGWVALAIGLALGLTAFLWIPALTEKGYVQLHMSRVTRNNDFHYNFLGLAEIFAPPAPFDTSLMNPPMEIHLGMVQVVLGGIGLVVGLVRVRKGSKEARGQEGRRVEEQWGSLLFFAASAALLVSMSTRASLWLWEHLPLLPFVQFPWRFIGRAALPFALLIAALPFATRDLLPATCSLRPTACFLLPLLTVALILAAFPSTYPPYGTCPRPPQPTVTDIHRYEHESRLVGVDPEGSYFPVWVEERPTGSPLEAQYVAGGTVARFDETALPERATVLQAEYGPNRARLMVESPTPFRARYLAFYFPGWRVRIDERPVEIAPSDPEGLLTFDVPAGRHTIDVRFTETPLRLVADAVSLLCLLTLFVFAVRGPGSEAAWPPSHRITRSQSVGLLLLALCLLALKLLAVDRTGTPFRRPSLRADGTLRGVEHPLNQSYADGLTLIGYDLVPTEMPADGTLRVNLYWTARERPARQYQTVVQLIGPDGFLWSPSDSFRPRGYHRPPPTDAWEPGRYALDSHEVEPLTGAPPGTYRVVVVVFDRETLEPLSILNEAGQPAAPELVLGEVTLTRPRRSAEPPARDRLDLSLGDLTLLTADFDPAQAAPGDAVHASFLWQVDRQPTAELTATLSLVAPGGTPAATYSLSPLVPWFPATAWHPGDVWRSQHQFTLPATLQTGSYTWTLFLSPCLPVFPSPCPSVPLSSLSVTAPVHTFTPPPMDLEIGARLGDIATLVGASLSPSPPVSLSPGHPVTVTLIWRAEATPSDSYHVFLHLLDPTGRIVAQSDGVPANWTRPTAGWLPGEYIADVRVLTLPPDAPPGEYVLQAGLYLPGDGRLTAPDGSDAIHLTTFEVTEEQ